MFWKYWINKNYIQYAYFPTGSILHLNLTLRLFRRNGVANYGHVHCNYSTCLFCHVPVQKDSIFFYGTKQHGQIKWPYWQKLGNTLYIVPLFTGLKCPIQKFTKDCIKNLRIFKLFPLTGNKRKETCFQHNHFSSILEGISSYLYQSKLYSKDLFVFVK